ncbi:site-2 protease family protein [Maricaulis sp.]|uniref:site-2 protease family protein n=1 Tax=Maricaulis sp. TaxID=1486257 RepID=UPI00263130BB|nr:site-2 protease family protein [Maricaulis sp.]
MRPYIFSVKIRGVVVRAEPSWLFLVLLVAWSLAVGFFPDAEAGLSTQTYIAMAILAVAGLTFSIVAHELSHTFVGRAFGLPIHHVTLFLFGGAAELEEEPDRPLVELVMALAGPVMSLFLALIFSSAAGWPGLQESWQPLALVLSYLGLINLILALFNMVPAFPLDGGRVLRAILWMFGASQRQATRIASLAGEVFAVFLMVNGVLVLLLAVSAAGLWWILIGFFLRSAARSARLQLETRLALRELRVADLIRPGLETVDARASVEDFIREKLVFHHRDWCPVVDQGRLIGGAGVLEAEAVPREDRLLRRVGEIAVKPLAGQVIDALAKGDTALRRMQHHHLDRLYVVDGDRLAGVLMAADLVAYAQMKHRFEDAGMS